MTLLALSFLMTIVSMTDDRLIGLMGGGGGGGGESNSLVEITRLVRSVGDKSNCGEPD
jgi:hypothetical protein